MFSKRCVSTTHHGVLIYTPPKHILSCVILRTKGVLGKHTMVCSGNTLVFTVHVVYCMLKCLIIACINYHLLSKLARQQIAVLQNLTASFTKWIRLPFLAVNFDNLQQVEN